MLILLSPAKIQNFEPSIIVNQFTQPQFIKEAEQLVDLLRNLSQQELSKLLDINANLTHLNFDRYFNWHRPFSLKNAKQAVFAFDGEVYRGLNAKTFTQVELDYAQHHLRLLSGLYGVLRPLDLIQPYRLEVSSKLKNPLGNDLYTYWKEKVTKAILKDIKVSGKPQVLLNLASSEYFKTINLKNNNIKVLDVEFFEYKNDDLKQIIIYTKKARGLMARYIIKYQIENTEELKGFSDEGYWFSPQLSNENKYVFTR